jgi:hypothetical protein
MPRLTVEGMRTPVDIDACTSWQLIGVRLCAIV